MTLVAPSPATDSGGQHFGAWRLAVAFVALLLAAPLGALIAHSIDGQAPVAQPTNTASVAVPGQGPSSPAAVAEAINAPRPNAIADWTGESVRLTHAGSYSWNTATKVVTAMPSSLISGGFAVQGGHALISGFRAVPVAPTPTVTPAPGAAISAPTYWHVTFSVSELKGSPRLILLNTYING